ncbi:hypothetical protein BDF19DRAFT_438736 [Syncephalis fuscata]|nr:hypothetical protein BDF19DRAFT_438736 [Syncephalis fuscata]
MTDIIIDNNHVNHHNNKQNDVNGQSRQSSTPFPLTDDDRKVFCATTNVVTATSSTVGPSTLASHVHNNGNTTMFTSANPCFSSSSYSSPLWAASLMLKEEEDRVKAGRKMMAWRKRRHTSLQTPLSISSLSITPAIINTNTATINTTRVSSVPPIAPYPPLLLVPQLCSHPCSAAGDIVHGIERWLGDMALPVRPALSSPSSLASSAIVSQSPNSHLLLKTPKSPRIAPQATIAAPSPRWLPSPLCSSKEDLYPWHDINYVESNSDDTSNTNSGKEALENTSWHAYEPNRALLWTAKTGIFLKGDEEKEEFKEPLVDSYWPTIDVDTFSSENDEGDEDDEDEHVPLPRRSRLLTEQISILEGELQDCIRQQAAVQSGGLIGVSVDLHIQPSEQLDKDSNCAVEALKHEYSFVCQSKVRVWPALLLRVSEERTEADLTPPSCICAVHIERNK